MKNQRIFALGAALCAIATAGPALANNGPALAVSYSDLNLATAEGQVELEKRIDKAARKICRVDAIRTGTHVPNPDARTCYAAAKASTKSQLAVALEKAAKKG